MPVTVYAVTLTTSPSAGESMVTCGGMESNVTEMLALPTLSAASLATQVMMLLPSFKGTFAPKPLALIPAVLPLHVTSIAAAATVPETAMVGRLNEDRL